MKHDDLLLEATRALREELADEAPPSASGREPASLTRGRIMQSLHDKRRKRATRLTVLLPLAAIFIGGSAWATSRGYHRVASEVTALFGGASSVEPVPGASPPPSLTSRVEAPAGEVAPEDEVAPAEEVAPADEVAPAGEVAADEVAPAGDEPVLADAEPPTATPPAPAAVEPAPPPASSAPKAAPAVAIDPDRALYEEAHRAHFVDKSPSAALAAWEAYLARSPGGVFITEATYNRALCLVRLGRVDEARAALAPFAEGRYGAYRQSEARELIEALGP